VDDIPAAPDSEGRLLEEVVDGQAGRVRARGHLTVQGADLISGTVHGLRRMGHSTVVLDLAGVQAADLAGLEALATLCSSMAHVGVDLLVRDVPGPRTPGH